MDQLDLKKRPRILLADDSVTIRKVIELTFADEGIDVTSVADGDEAMRSFVDEQPDLLIADVNMPGISGYTLCEMIKLDETTRDIPVVLLTGSFEPFDAGEASRVGANYYFTKPFASIREVVEKVSDLLDNRDFDPGMFNETADIDDLYVESVYAQVDEPIELESTTDSEELAREAEHDFAQLAFLDEAIQEKVEPEPAAEIVAEESVTFESIYGLIEEETVTEPTEPVNTDPFERIVDDEPAEIVAAPAEVEIVTVDADLEYLNEPADVAEPVETPAATFHRIFDDSEFDDELIEEFRPNAAAVEEAAVDTTPVFIENPVVANTIDPFATTAETPIQTESAESTLIRFEIEDTEPAKPAAAYSPELVDAIVDRLMERLSDKAVREAAQEAVPRIAEKLIREALDTETNS